MSLMIPGAVGPLEAKLWRPSGGRAARAAAVFCHPHPLHGGTMNTTAVFRAARGLEEAGLAVLRFNFRGVGKSAGVHDGKGAEEQDLRAALDYMEREFPGVELWAGGFSFGSRTSAAYAPKDPRIRRVLFVAVPVRAYDCAFIRQVRQPGLILMAGNDEFGNLRELKDQYPDLPANLETDEIPDTNHFFETKTQELQARVRRWAERCLAEQA
jgi:alpha/beta superfamily hydrolase